MNSQKTPEQLISELTQAFDLLPILEDQKGYLENFIRMLANGMSKAVHTPLSNHFIKKPKTLIPELEGLLKRTVDLDHFLSQIHQDTILAIPDVNARTSLEQACRQMICALEIAVSAHISDEEEVIPIIGGRPPKLRAIQLADILARSYWQLTGKMPTITVDPTSEGNIAMGDFLRLVDDVFGSLKVEANPEHFARLAIENLKEKTPPQAE